ncbi:hypothetical protein [Sphingomonas sp. GC_Shp_3]|uniref:hypothetical protein n=1 Tax=Sphingomonas sp. GC_Shp_3 TaxID=2937383 RepID=UPI00226A2249|nr:hypothetical protein [Sphingomonas sp. GC_Shp_3]
MIAGAAAALTIAAPLVLAGFAAKIAVALAANRLIEPPITHALPRARGARRANVDVPIRSRRKDVTRSP